MDCSGPRRGSWLKTTNHTTGGDRPQKVIVRTELRAFSSFYFYLFPPHFRRSTPPHPTPDRPPPTLCSMAGGPGRRGARGAGRGGWGVGSKYAPPRAIQWNMSHTPPPFTPAFPLLPLPQVSVSAKCKRRATYYRALQSISTPSSCVGDLILTSHRLFST